MPCRREDYPDSAEPPWLDRPDASLAIDRKLAAGELTEPHAAELRTWVRDGYLVIPGVLDRATAEEINADVDAILEANRELPLDQLKKKFENVYRTSEATRRALVTPLVLELLDRLLGTRVIPHQTLNLPVSSQQAAHSDEILMTTHPPGYTVAVWFALEDIQPDSGP